MAVPNTLNPKKKGRREVVCRDWGSNELTMRKPSGHGGSFAKWTAYLP